MPTHLPLQIPSQALWLNLPEPPREPLECGMMTFGTATSLPLAAIVPGLQAMTVCASLRVFMAQAC